MRAEASQYANAFFAFGVGLCLLVLPVTSARAAALAAALCFFLPTNLAGGSAGGCDLCDFRAGLRRWGAASPVTLAPMSQVQCCAHGLVVPILLGPSFFFPMLVSRGT